jgi:hypothetical protein
MGVFTVGAVAANYLAWLAAATTVRDAARWSISMGIAASFVWGFVFGVAVAVCAASVFVRARRLRFMRPTILISTVVALVYMPLHMALVYTPFEAVMDGFIRSIIAISLTTGLVYAAVAAVLGWELIRRAPE